ncbi:hypothetical protein TNCV_3939661 [Trichonephila clavipes]|uniref:Uncharacterized protein n=1 Tax=Trichonephila clavipes TaxID=2585209 RepID=A0A8X6VVM7_TRICX|nr:hypothetical protein TNCV_3939661 [Trichonephila clavipes]
MFGHTQQGYHKAVFAPLPPIPGLLYPQISHQSSLSGRQIGQPTTLVELEACLQQLWNEMSQDIIRNLYDLMPARIKSCICARGGLTELTVTSIHLYFFLQ